jgi:hypothetical protein
LSSQRTADPGARRSLRYQKALIDVLRVRRKRARFLERPALTPLGILIGLLIIFT